MKQVHIGLGGLLAFCLGLRAAAWLIGPAIPVVAVLFGLAAILTILVQRTSRY